MRLLKWTPNFDVWEESPIAPVWISFMNLRLHFCNSQVLFRLASIFDRPFQTDEATASITQPSIARVLVELDVSKKHPGEVWLGFELNGYFQKVEFENLLIFRSHCKMHGLGFKDCFRLHPHLRKEKYVPKQSQAKDDNEILQSVEGLNARSDYEPINAVAVPGNVQSNLSPPLVTIILENIPTDHPELTTLLPQSNNDVDLVVNYDLNDSSSKNNIIPTLPIINFDLNSNKSIIVDELGCFVLKHDDAVVIGLTNSNSNVGHTEHVLVETKIVDLGLVLNMVIDCDEALEEDELPHLGKRKDTDCKSPSSSHFDSDAFTDNEEL
ncbi:uncharacterized protein LOC110108744 [Dendrobium catenatum]|uniref:uncharacterized protein LOC110108744 n=1 Tax=Dendrobium catenatum TaxID=906689 RepID=UPI0009F374B2|nr:uncharacterized protein LOC110108744 [Dendrobium catenatum]